MVWYLEYCMVYATFVVCCIVREILQYVLYTFCVFIQEHPWLTKGGSDPLPSTYDNCATLEPTEEEINNSIRYIPKLKTLVRIFFVFYKYINTFLSTMMCTSFVP